jgi:hypothetical protein
MQWIKVPNDRPAVRAAVSVELLPLVVWCWSVCFTLVLLLQSLWTLVWCDLMCRC